MTKMGELVLDELGKINETAVQVIEEMKERGWKEKHVGWVAWNAVVEVLGWVGRGIWGVDPMYIDRFSRLPVPRIVFSLLTLLWYLFRSAFSSLMSVLVVLMSSKRFFSGIPSVSVHNNDLESQPYTQPQFRYPSRQSTSQMPILPPQIPRLDPRLLHLYTRPRISRIPDRLCKPKSEVTSDRLGRG
ncbi:hypothetical protein PILCRDRAFT_345752 [Piloderma croceum F 1598]|uniref:Uncharacterized protein n=1 Tax=Piloderma croceum (strain F 1598) TaxID=765440 RepID=A0A0C3G1T3_PILCF|nr:hypothetical protein PILCRDRAFT_345752 [Piloderma croceum F 1598]